jgi:hypothetical protein
LDGREIDLDPDDATLLHIHTAVRERCLADGSANAAVYPTLKAGSYTVEGSSQRVNIVGGQVTEVTFECC